MWVVMHQILGDRCVMRLEVAFSGDRSFYIILLERGHPLLPFQDSCINLFLKHSYEPLAHSHFLFHKQVEYLTIEN